MALLLASFRELLRVAPGYETKGILTASTLAPSSRYAGAAELDALMSRSLDALRSIPGVVAAGATSAIPLQSNFGDSVILPEGYVKRAGETVIAPIRVVATTGYLEAMGIRLAAGRSFDERDGAAAQQVILIDKRLAAKFWPGQEAVGRRMFQPSGREWANTDGNTRWLTVVGVVEATRLKNLAGTGEEAGTFYLPHAQSPARSFTFAVKTSVDPASLTTSLRTTLGRIDPVLALFDVQTMEQRVASSLASRRAALILSLMFGAISLLLASLGLYGVLSYLFTQRRREIGVRMAIGCTPAQAFWLFLREGAVLTGSGIALGALVAFAGQNIAASFAYGVRPFDAGVLGAVLLTLTAVAFLAISLPARQAAKVDSALTLAEQ